ncbi:MAG: hypothetical protein IKL79_01620 [Clostridia bacterium]|nr:hypothetical protein [Clostridia bacterium]MBR3680685.1 hypothetical protein [Clostridia bacterium]
MFSIGEKVVYGAYGVMKIVDVRDIEIGDCMRKYYVLCEAGAVAFSETLIPVDNQTLVAGMRRLLSPDGMLAAIKAAKAVTDLPWVEDNRARAEHFKSVMTSGDRTAILVMIRSIVAAGVRRAAEGKKNFLADENAMKKAEKILYSEISAVMEIPTADVPAFIESV